jgi:hypothetical protein
MEEHFEAVASRALIVARPSKNRELKDVLALPRASAWRGEE